MHEGKERVTEPSIESTDTGIVAILDVLGSRGSWVQTDPRVVVGRVYDRMEKLKTIPPAVSLSGPEYVRYDDDLEEEVEESDTLSTWELSTYYFSDTAIIVANLSTFHPDAFDYFARFIAVWFAESIRERVAYRGAIATGQWARKGSVLVGPAIDEAADWEKRADWAGVMLTPSAWSDLNRRLGEATEGITWLLKDDIPLKAGGNFHDGWAINWPLLMSRERAAVEKPFLRPPVSDEVQRKLQNTLVFFEASRKDAEARASAEAAAHEARPEAPRIPRPYDVSWD